MHKYTATHSNTRQHTATHCNTLQHTATHCNTLQHSMVAVLHENISHMGRSSNASDPPRTWPSVEKAVQDIDTAITDGLNVHKSVVLFVERQTQCFWTLSPPKIGANGLADGACTYVRVPYDTFPLKWVDQNKALLSYPPLSPGAMTAEQVSDVKGLARRFVPNFTLESLLACPLLAANGYVQICFHMYTFRPLPIHTVRKSGMGIVELQNSFGLVGWLPFKHFSSCTVIFL